MKNKFKRLLTDTVIFAVGSIGSKVLLFLLLPLYTNVLSKAEYGTADLILTVGQLALPLVSLAIYNGVIRFGLNEKEVKENVLICSLTVFLFGSLLVVALFPILLLFEAVSEYAIYICAYIILNFLLMNSNAYLLVKSKRKTYAMLSVAHALLLALSNVLFLVGLALGVKGYLLSSIVSTGVISILCFILGGCFQDLKKAHFDKALFKKMVVYSLPFILNDIAWWLVHSSDKVMLDFYLGAAALGLYTAASKIPSLINVFASIFSQAWGLSSIKEFDHENDPAFYSRVFKYFSMCMFGVCVVVIAIVKVFMSFYVGPEFYEAWKYVPLLVSAAIFSSFSAFSNSMLGAMKKSKYITYVSFIAGAVNITINFILINFIGIWGAVVGTLVACLLSAVLGMLFVRKGLKIDYDLLSFVPLSLLVIGEAVLVGLDFHAVIVGVCSIVIFFALEAKNIYSLFDSILKKDKKGDLK